MKEELKRWREYLMTGVSYMIPIVVIGGVLIALGIALSGVEAGKGANVTNPFLLNLMDIGGAAFSMMVPILAGYIAYGIADRPGLAPGLVGGVLANNIKAGFLGGIIAGLIAGYIARWIKSWKVPKNLKPIMPIFVIPLLSSLVVGLLMIYVVGSPISSLMESMTSGLKSMGSGNAVVLAIIMGAMIAFDMGGPVNKVAFMFGAAMITEGVFTVMGPVAAAICIPPLGLGVATLLAPKKYTETEREAGKGALAMGLIGITEGAIPFAASDPLRVIPSIVVGSSVGAAIAAIGKVGDHAPHGGPIVLPVVDNKIMFIIAILVGIVVTALMVNFLKKTVTEELEEVME
jgi:fructose-specific PTS system IIC-like component